MKNYIIIILLFLFPCYSFSQSIDSSRFYFQKGTEESNERRFAVASKNFDKAIQFNQNYTEAYIENGKADLEMRKIDAALGNFTKAYQLQPSNTEIVKELSTLYFNTRQFQKAIDLSQKCNCPDADRIIGMSYYELEDFGKSQTYLQKALNINDKDAEAAYTLGHAYLELENEKGAIEQYQKAISIAPSQNAWVYELGLIYYNRSDYKNALKYFQMAGDSGYNKSNDYYENLGFAQMYTGDMQNGMKNLNIVLDKKPNNKELLNNIANAMYDTKQYDSSLHYFSKLLELNPRDATSLYMAGMAFQKKGEKEKGQKICDKAISMDPSLAKNRQKRDLPMGL